MAGIFNLFGDVSGSNAGQPVKALQRSKTTLGIHESTSKTVAQSKPKGLSIRPNADINIRTSPRKSGLKQDNFHKQLDLLKPKLTQLDNNGQPISPKKKLLEQSVKLKDLSSKKLAFQKKHVEPQKPEVFEENVFKKPLPPRKFNRKSYREPEILAPFCDMQLEFEDVFTQTIANEFRETLMKKAMEVQPYIDEGFESDPELLEYEIPSICESPLSHSDTQDIYSTPDLPEICDDCC